jgi:hypothetical protein
VTDPVIRLILNFALGVLVAMSLIILIAVLVTRPWRRK